MDKINKWDIYNEGFRRFDEERANQLRKLRKMSDREFDEISKKILKPEEKQL